MTSAVKIFVVLAIGSVSFALISCKKRLEETSTTHSARLVVAACTCNGRAETKGQSKSKEIKAKMSIFFLIIFDFFCDFSKEFTCLIYKGVERIVRDS